MTATTKLVILAGVALGATAILSGLPHAVSAETMKMVPAPALDETAGAEAAPAIAVFAGGCFWGVQGVYQHVDGVLSAVSGYSGGSKLNASYPIVSTGTTGHAESVKITYDPRKVTYGKLLQIYFSVVADPTTLNAQGPDEGPQYRSDIFATTPKQAEIAKAYIAQLGGAHAFARPIVTKVDAFTAFYPAEGYHQNYLTEHPHNPYIAINDMPKVDGLKALFADTYRDTPILTAASAD